MGCEARGQRSGVQNELRGWCFLRECDRRGPGLPDLGTVDSWGRGILCRVGVGSWRAGAALCIVGWVFSSNPGLDVLDVYGASPSM